MINNPKLQLSSSKILNIDINIANFQIEDIKQFSSLKILNILNFFCNISRLSHLNLI